MNNIKTILLTLGLFGVSSVNSLAQSFVKGVVIETAGGQQTEYALTDTPKLTYDGSMVTLTTTKVSVYYTASNIVKVMLTDISSTGIDDVENGRADIQLSNDEVRMSGLVAGEKVTLYYVNGTLHSTWKATSAGELTISLSDLKQGVYIIYANHQSFKVIRK